MLKHPLSNINISTYDECDIKVPLVDLVADSPSSIQDDTGDASDFLNSSLFLNTDMQDCNYNIDDNSNTNLSNNKNDEDKNNTNHNNNNSASLKSNNDKILLNSER